MALTNFLAKIADKHVILALTAIRMLLDYVYLFYIQPTYEYWGYTANPTNQSFLISYILFFVGVFLVLPHFKSERFVESNMIVLLFIIGFIPTTSIIACDQQPISFVIANAIYWFLIIRLPLVIGPKQMNVGTLPMGAIIAVGFFFSLIVLYLCWEYTGFRILLSLDNVYEYRMQARDYNLSRFFIYMWSASRIVLPIVVTVCLMNKQYLLSAFFILIIVLNFSIDGMKSTIFSLFVCIFLYFFVKGDFKSKYPMVVLILFLISLLEYKYNGVSSISELVIRRNFLVTAILDTRYYDLVSQYSPVFWSYEIDGKNVAFMVGDIYFDRDEMRANNGLFSDAYMNLGYLGCIIYPLVYTYIIKYSESLLKYSNRGLVMLICILWVYKMRGSVLTAVFLTHGLAFALLLLALLPNSRSESEYDLF